MIEKVCHVGPALSVQGGICSVLLSYKKLFGLTEKNFLATYNGSFLRSLPLVLKTCLKVLFASKKSPILYELHTASYGSFWRMFVVSLFVRLRGMKYAPHVHGSVFDEFCNNSSAFTKKAIRSYFRNAAKIIVLSSEMEAFLRSFDPELHNFATVPNPCESIASSPVDLSKHVNPVKVIFSGRFGDRKGVLDLIKAFDATLFDVPAELFLFGDGEIERVRNAVSQSKKKDVIHVSPWLRHDEYIKQLSEYDLLVLPSYAERFSMSLVEALGMGLPVISTFVGGTAEVVDDGVCGILCNPGDIQALTKALEKLVNDKNLRIQMGLAGWNRAKSNFTADVVLNKLERVYEDIACC